MLFSEGIFLFFYFFHFIFLGNLKVRISEPWGKSAPRKISEILLWLERFKNDHFRVYKGWGVVRVQVLLSSSQCALLLPKNALLFPELPFYFPEKLFYFLELPICFLELSFCFLEVPFISQKYCCFPQLPFSFPEVPFYLLCVSFSKNAFFPS